MIIELFGPPGAGKTTLGKLLATRLRERGCVVELVQSYRPNERMTSAASNMSARKHRRVAAAARRVARPIMEMLSLTIRRPTVSERIGSARELLKILPPRSVLWSMRMNQYITRLSHSWSRACSSSKVTVFDQAYVQAVCSLSLLSGAEDNTQIARALDCVPEADLLIDVDAPREVLKARLHKRRSHQSTFERWLELDLKESLAAKNVAEHLHRLLCQRGRQVRCVDYVDEHSLPEAAKRIAEQVTLRLGSHGDRSVLHRTGRTELANRPSQGGW
jgi:thymidylate kinase